MGGLTDIRISPNPKQELFFNSHARYTAYGGARGGGKSWAMRIKLVLLALRYDGINDEYDALIKETKDKLRSYSDATAVLTQKYAEARAQYEAAKEKSAQILEKNYNRDRNAAAAQVKLDEKNTGEYLASRGLATSGESVQAKLNSNIALNNALSGLSAEHESKLADMLSEKDEYLSRLGIDYAKEYADAENKLLSQAAEVAESKLKHTSSKSGSASENPAVSDAGGAAEGDGLFDPEMTPYQLASAIVRKFTGGNTVKYAEDNLEISDYLKKLSERYSLTDDFRDQLVFALDALGYSALDDESNALTRLIYDAETEYSDAYSRAAALAKKTIPDYEKRQAFIKNMHISVSSIIFLHGAKILMSSTKPAV